MKNYIKYITAEKYGNDHLRLFKNIRNNQCRADMLLFKLMRQNHLE